MVIFNLFLMLINSFIQLQRVENVIFHTFILQILIFNYMYRLSDDQYILMYN